MKTIFAIASMVLLLAACSEARAHVTAIDSPPAASAIR